MELLRILNMQNLMIYYLLEVYRINWHKIYFKN